MIWLLDTHTLVHALNGVRSVCARLNQVPPEDRVVTSVLVVAELMSREWYGDDNEDDG